MAEIVVSAPGKVILHGEHSVVYGKVAVAASLNLRCFLRVTFPENKDVVVLDLPDVNIHHSWSLLSLRNNLLPSLECTDGLPTPPSEKSLQALKMFIGLKQDKETDTKDLSVIAFLYLYCCISRKEENGKYLPKLYVQLLSQLPVGAGLGSSAAFSVCMAAVLLQLAGQIGSAVSTQGQGDLNSQKSLMTQWSAEDQLLINKWAFLGEKIIHGQPSGIDNSVSTLDDVNTVKEIQQESQEMLNQLQERDFQRAFQTRQKRIISKAENFRSGGAICFQNKQITPLEKMPRIRILFTNTKVPRSTKKLVAGVRERHDKLSAVMVPLLNAMDGLAHLSIEAYRELHDQPDDLHGYSKLEELIDMNQHLLNAIGVGHASLDSVVQVTAQYQLHTKLTGAGGGGCALTLLRPDTTAEAVSAVMHDLEQFGFKSWETSVGAPGVSVHPDPHDDMSVPRQLLHYTRNDL